MPTRTVHRDIRLLRLATALVLTIVAGACASSADPGAVVPQPASSASPAVRSLQDTAAIPFEFEDFDAVHGPRDGRDGSVIFGALAIAPAGALEPRLAAFVGRWEGYGLGPPIRRDWKYVLAVTEIDGVGGTAYMWAGTNLQFPAAVEKVEFRVRGQGPETVIEWEQLVDGAYAIVRIRHAGTTDALEGGVEASDPAIRMGRILLRRDSTEHRVHHDYEAHLASLGIRWKPYPDDGRAAFGDGWLVHLPPSYAEEPDRRWPLILFLHGSGDRGTNGLLIAQNSPMRSVIQGNRLDAIVVAPLLRTGTPTFPDEYLDQVLDAAAHEFRTEPGVRLTGLSMGGEAAYRLARARPASVARLAVLCGFDAADFPAAVAWGYQPIAAPPASLRDTPVLVIHGAEDTVVPLEAARSTVNALVAAGVGVRFDVLAHHDHDVWTDTYADPSFFAWLLGPG